MAKQVWKESTRAEPLFYTGKVSAIGSGQPIQGATVVVRRSVYNAQENKILQETQHETEGPLSDLTRVALAGRQAEGNRGRAGKVTPRSTTSETREEQS